jgi:hypothetical protein
MSASGADDATIDGMGVTFVKVKVGNPADRHRTEEQRRRRSNTRDVAEILSSSWASLAMIRCSA